MRYESGDKHMDFSISKYGKLLLDEKTQEAKQYREACIPDTLYKFMSLTKDNCLNRKKLQTIKSDCLWAAPAEDQNDPYEFIGVYLNKAELQKSGISEKDTERYMQRFRSLFCLAAFTSEMVENLPMWAHYSNNHKGFCIKYVVESKKYMRNVLYEPKRIPIANIFLNYITAERLAERDPTMKAKAEHYALILQDLYFVKHRSWEYEHEYRIIYPWETAPGLKGLRISNKDAGIRIDTIYSGYQCSDIHKDKLRSIASMLKVDYKECKISDTSFAVFE